MVTFCVLFFPGPRELFPDPPGTFPGPPGTFPIVPGPLGDFLGDPLIWLVFHIPGPPGNFPGPPGNFCKTLNLTRLTFQFDVYVFESFVGVLNG